MNVTYIQPMLAHTKPADQSLLEDDTYWAQEKLDGERRLLLVNPSGLHLTGRNLLKNGQVSDAIEKVPHLFDHPIAKMNGCIFDGELMHPNGFQSLAKVMRSSVDKALQEQDFSGRLVYHIYDILSCRGTSLVHLPYSSRYHILQQLFVYFPKHSDVLLVPCSRTTKEKQDLFNSIHQDETKEGLMFRNHMGIYEEGRRSTGLLRLKKEFTEDVIITGLLPSVRDYTGKNLSSWSYWENPETMEKHEGTRPSDSWDPVTRNYYQGLPGAFSFAQYDTAGHLRELGAAGGFTREMAQSMKDSPKDWIGRVVEIKANERFADTGHFRHPRFFRLRDDKAAIDCKLHQPTKE